MTWYYLLNKQSLSLYEEIPKYPEFGKMSTTVFSKSSCYCEYGQIALIWMKILRFTEGREMYFSLRAINSKKKSTGGFIEVKCK